MKILVAVDDSDYSKRTLAYLSAHDEWLGPTQDYTVLTVVPAVPPRAAAVMDGDDLRRYYEEEGEKVLAPIRAFFAPKGMSVRFKILVGHAAERIAEEARDGRHALLMMGSRGHSALENLVLGSVTTKVMALTEVPVLLVR